MTDAAPAASTPAAAPAVAPAPVDDARKVFAGNLAFSTKEEELKEIFSSAGKVIDVQIIMRGTRSLGYGFVTFETEAEAQKAVSTLDKKEIDGREINVEGAKPQAQQPAKDGAEKAAAGEGKKAKKPKAKKASASRRPRADDGEEGTGEAEAEAAAEGTAAAEKTNGRTAAAPGNGESKSARRRKAAKAKKAENAANGIEAGAEGDAAAAKTSAPKETKPREPRKPKPPPTGEPSKTTLLAVNLPFTYSDDDLKALFEGHNPTSTKIIRSRNRFGKLRSRGFGFITFADEESQKKALEALNGKEIENRAIGLKVAIDEEKREDKEGETPAAAEGETKEAAEPAAAA